VGLASLRAIFARVGLVAPVVFPFATDLGVERSLFFPWEIDEQPLQKHLACTDDFEAARAVQDNLVADLSGAIDVAGLLHAIHNATNDLAAVMPEYSEQVGRLRHISNMLSNTCYTCPVGHQFRKEIATFSSPVNIGRWGTVAKAVEEIWHIQHPLQCGWSLCKFEHGKMEQESRTTITASTLTI
jgi:hypothetical protein